MYVRALLIVVVAVAVGLYFELVSKLLANYYRWKAQQEPICSSLPDEYVLLSKNTVLPNRVAQATGAVNGELNDALAELATCIR